MSVVDLETGETINVSDGAPFQQFDDLDAATEAALLASIVRHGVLVPITVDQQGRIIDGHHRHRLAAETDTDCPARVIEVENARHARTLAAELNAVRRHLDIDQRREIVADLRAEGHSLRAIAAAVGVSHEQVRKDTAGVNQLTPDRVTGADGKSYPATKPDAESGKAAEEPAALSEVPALPAPEPDDGVPLSEVVDTDALRRARFAKTVADTFAALTRSINGLDPAEAAAVIEPTRWDDIERSAHLVTKWLDDLLSARPRHLTPVEGGRK